MTFDHIIRSILRNLFGREIPRVLQALQPIECTVTNDYCRWCIQTGLRSPDGFRLEKDLHSDIYREQLSRVTPSALAAYKAGGPCPFDDRDQKYTREIVEFLARQEDANAKRFTHTVLVERYKLTHPDARFSKDNIEHPETVERGIVDLLSHSWHSPNSQSTWASVEPRFNRYRFERLEDATLFKLQWC